jgi:hypothetical protein
MIKKKKRRWRRYEHNGEMDNFWRLKELIINIWGRFKRWQWKA